MLPCPDCGVLMLGRIGLGNHRVARHGWRTPHGTVSRYVDGCRCMECRVAQRITNRARRRARAGTVPTIQCPHCRELFTASGLRSHSLKVHGERMPVIHGESGYIGGCRCAICRDGARTARTRYRSAARARVPGAVACDLCGVVMSARGLRVHTNRMHGGDGERVHG